MGRVSQHGQPPKRVLANALVLWIFCPWCLPTLLFDLPMDIKEQILQDPKQQLLADVRRLPIGQLLLWRTQILCRAAPGELLLSIEGLLKLGIPPEALLQAKSQARIVAKYRNFQAKREKRRLNRKIVYAVRD